MYLDYAELQAENHNAMSMKDWVEKLNAFLQFNGKEILHNAEKISAEHRDLARSFKKTIKRGGKCLINIVTK